MRKVSWWICTAFARACGSLPLLCPETWLPSALQENKTTTSRAVNRINLDQKATVTSLQHWGEQHGNSNTEKNQDTEKNLLVYSPATSRLLTNLFTLAAQLVHLKISLLQIYWWPDGYKIFLTYKAELGKWKALNICSIHDYSNSRAKN